MGVANYFPPASIQSHFLSSRFSFDAHTHAESLSLSLSHSVTMFLIHFLHRSIESIQGLGLGREGGTVILTQLFSFSQNKVVDVDNLKVKLQVRTEKRNPSILLRDTALCVYRKISFFPEKNT